MRHRELQIIVLDQNYLPVITTQVLGIQYHPTLCPCDLLDMPQHDGSEYTAYPIDSSGFPLTRSKLKDIMNYYGLRYYPYGLYFYYDNPDLMWEFKEQKYE